MFKLPELHYAYSALEKAIDEKTMEIHHGKHHATYVNNLNAALGALGGGWQDLDLKTLLRRLPEVPEEQRAAIRNNAGGHFNHELFWKVLGPKGGGEPRGDLAGAIDKSFGTFGRLKEELTRAAIGRFGSGWAWLTLKDRKLLVQSTPNQDNPLMDGSGTPILGLDVWEHAYYLRYQNRRPDYVKALFEVIDWGEVGRRYAEALA